MDLLALSPHLLPAVTLHLVSIVTCLSVSLAGPAAAGQPHQIPGAFSRPGMHETHNKYLLVHLRGGAGGGSKMTKPLE